MAIHTMIHKLRTGASLSQEEFAGLFGVSRQAVQKWESGISLPELDKLIKMAKYFDVSIDAMVWDGSTRITETMKGNRELKPKYANIHDWELYSANLMIEYRQSLEEGLDVAPYKDLFLAVSRLPRNETRKRFGDILFDLVNEAAPVDRYPYTEPSDLESIRALRKAGPPLPEVKQAALGEKIHGAWMGRICGCLLGKTVEGMRTDELIPFLKMSGNYPMHRYIRSSDVSEAALDRFKFPLKNRCFADTADGMPADDDTNYVVLAQQVIDRHGRDFTPFDMSREWLALQPKDAYCTAERVAFCNFVNGYEPPESAAYKNPYREWIGAQIRGDYFGYINPGNPELAAEMAFRDASISHVKNGIYGEMFVAAMLAVAACTSDIPAIIAGGLAQIPHSSRLYAAITDVQNAFTAGVPQKDCFRDIHSRYDEYTEHGWCHTIPNAMIVAASLLYGRGDYGRSICMAVETGFDTDCNGATVGSVLGMANGIDSIGAEWTAPINDTLHTTIFGVGTVKIPDAVRHTMTHLRLKGETV